MNNVTPPPQDHILLVEDDPIGGRQLARFLGSFGYQVTLVTGQAAALERLAVQRFQAAIIDLTLTDGDGFGVLEAVRARDPLIPIICTSGQSDLSARVLGLKAGFDLYLGKPFEPLELEALLTAALRGRRRYAEHQDGAAGAALPERWRVDPGERCLTFHHGARIPLSEAELRFLQLLRDQAPATVDRHTIIAGLGQSEVYYGRSRLDTMISRLRQKIALLTPEPPPFKSVYATGYVWVQALARDTVP